MPCLEQDGLFCCFPVVADGNLVKDERFSRKAPFRRRGNLRLLLNCHQQPRENNKKVHSVPEMIISDANLEGSSF